MLQAIKYIHILYYDVFVLKTTISPRLGLSLKFFDPWTPMQFLFASQVSDAPMLFVESSNPQASSVELQTASDNPYICLHIFSIAV